MLVWNNWYSTNNNDNGNQSSPMSKVNPGNKDGEISKCYACGSINHWTKSCPDLYADRMKIKETNFTLIGECMDSLIHKKH